LSYVKHSPAVHIPVTLVFAGNDPTGGAGIHADIEALASMGCHAACAVTCIAIQDTHDVKRIAPLDAHVFIEQSRAILEDMPVAAIKIGLLGSLDIIYAIHALLDDYPDIPVIMDPILKAGGGTRLCDDTMIAAMKSLLFPRVTVLTPNSPEARQLVPNADSLDACGMALLDSGCAYVLVTGTHEQTDDVTNLLYGNHRRLEAFSWKRLPDHYHGSGCTLSASIAGLLAHGHEPMSALREAQQYTWQTLKHGYHAGHGQMLPNRLFWAAGELAK